MLLYWTVIFGYGLSLCSAKQQIQNVVWEIETNHSINSNLRGKCSWQTKLGLSMPETSDTFFVNIIQPSKAEMNVFQKLPTTLTKANAALGPLNYQHQYNWSLETESQWVVPLDHVAQNKKNCYALTELTAKEGVLDLYQNFKSVHRTFYLLRNIRGVIHPSGSVMFSCGYYQGAEGCETRWGEHPLRWERECKLKLRKGDRFNDLFALPGLSTRKEAFQLLEECSYDKSLDDAKELNKTGLFTPAYHEKVYVISALWDYNYHHFIADCLARMARNIHYLRSHPEIMIHIRVVEKYDTNPVKSDDFKAGAQQIRDGLVSVLGIDPSRLIWGLVVAKEIYIPRGMHCAYALSNPLELRVLARELLRGAARQLNGKKQQSFLPTSAPTTVSKQIITAGGSDSDSSSSDGEKSLRSSSSESTSSSAAESHSAIPSEIERSKRLAQQKAERQSARSSSSSRYTRRLAMTAVEGSRESRKGGKEKGRKGGSALSRLIGLGSGLSGGESEGALNKDWAEKQFRASAMGKDAAPVKKNLIIQHRYTKYGSNERFWHNNTFEGVVADFAVVYPDHNIVRMVSTAASAPDYCLACDIREYAKADILVGLHGAGLTNMMFMPPNALIVEMVGDYKIVNMPYCGYYGAFSAIFGHHHYLHAYNFQKDGPIRSDEAARKSREFYDQLQKRDFSSLNVTTVVSVNMPLADY